MSRTRRLLRVLAAATVTVALASVVLYQFFGLRIVMDGGGTPRLRFVRPSAEQAERIERHREAQRTVPASTETGQESADRGPTPPPPAGGASDTEFGPAEAAGAEGVARASYWTDFRGPKRNGEYREQPIRDDWPPAGLTPLWKQPVGGGYASFVVARGRAFTIEQRGSQEVVAAYDVQTGRELWTNGWDAEFREAMGGDGPRATPTWAAGVVYALGAAGELRALNEARGRVLWRTNILADSRAGNLPWGMAAAPLVVDDTLIVLPGGRDGQSVVAYDRATGERRWSALADQQAYASPMLVTLAGVRQLLVFTATRLVGLAPENGRLLWEYAFPTFNGINAAQPLVLGDRRVFLSASYGAGAAVVELTPEGDTLSVREVWRNNRMKNRFSGSVLKDGVIYGLDEAILAAVDAETGELRWKGGRYGYGQLILAGDHLVVLTEDGELALVRANPARHEEVARFPVLEGKTWNVPALADGFLLVRNLNEMAAFDLRAGRHATR
jgi:outer membrane protein assembly factor BamB